MPPSQADRRAQVRDLADRLCLEYAEDVPPGQVLVLVFRTARHLACVTSLTAEPALDMCEIIVRRALVERLDQHRCTDDDGTGPGPAGRTAGAVPPAPRRAR